ncbi:armadillo-type protein [Rhodotorula diobovata]|uniref:Armadillo-type protein n=1 Tax=Rhodotorula diobovata TaxID=5288 RepID=A0A5C5FZX0_9BASI|nr:armadillo-type protein [Rhodotorula diobovata]
MRDDNASGELSGRRRLPHLAWPAAAVESIISHRTPLDSLALGRMEGELAQVVQAVQSLYSPSTPPSVQTALQQQLQHVQAAPAAWTIVGPLLSHPDASVRFFAASTLEHKLSRHWDSLPGLDAALAQDGLAGDLLGLKDSLLQWLAHSAAAAYPAPRAAARAPPVQGERPVVRKLAAAATALSLRVEARWPDWLLEVVMRVAAAGAGREASLEVLATAIEQVARAELVGSKRMSYMSSLSSTIPHLVSTLSSSLTSSSASEVNSALACFVSYLNAGQLSHTELTTLYPLLLPPLSNPSTVIAACSAVEELVERSAGLSQNISGSSSATRFVNRLRTTELITSWATGPYVSSVLTAAVSDARDGSEPDDETLAVFKLATTLADHFISTFLFDPPPASSSSSSSAATDPSSLLTLRHPAVHALFSLLLELSGFPGHSAESYAVNELPQGAWLNLQELGADEGFVAGSGDGREGRAGKEDEWNVYRGVWEALAGKVRERATRPPDEEVRGWPKDVRDAFRVYRSTTLSDSAQYAFFVLRESMIGSLVQLAAEQIAQPPHAGSDSHEDLEATLFVLYSLGEVVPLSPSLAELDPAAPPTPLSTYLSTLFGPSILGRLPSAPGSFPSLRSTALRLVGAYAPWFSAHADACLQAVSFVVAGLQEPELVPGAARALRGLCDANRKVLVPHVASFVQVLGGLEGTIDDSELVKVLESVASVVQALPENEVVEPLLVLANPTIAKLASSVQGLSQSPDEARDLALQQLSYLTALSRGLSDPEDDLVDLDASVDDSQLVRDSATRILSDPRVGDMRARLAAAVESAARSWAADMEVVGALSEYIRASTSDAVPSPLALDSLALLGLASSALQIAPNSVWLGIEGQLLGRLARSRSDAEIREDELVEVGRPVEVALNVVLSTHSDLSAMSENPDVVAAFLGLCCQIVRLYPRIFSALPPHYLDAVLAFAERGLAMQEQFSLKLTMELLLLSVQQTRMASSSASFFSTTLAPRVPTLVRAVLLAIAGGAPRSHLVQLSELLHACLLRLSDGARPAVKELLAQPGWPNERASDEVKGKFGRAVLSARTGKQVRQAVQDFALVCRGLDGSAYGAATTAL